MLPSTTPIEWQNVLMDRIEALGYKIEDRQGVCYGLTNMAIQAWLSGNFHTFEERLNFFYNTPIETLQEIAKLSGSDVTQSVVDFRAFAEGVMLYQTPYAHPELFDEKSKPTKQQDHRLVEPILRSREFEKLGGLDELKSFSGIYSLDELTNYFKLLSESFAGPPKLQHPIALSLMSFGHSIGVAYNPNDENHPWVLIDANQFPINRYDSDEGIAQGVMSAFFLKNTIAFSSTICVAKNHSLEQRVFVDKCMSNAKWQEMHEPTDDKAELVDDGSISWLMISARNGHLDEVDKLLRNTNINPDAKDVRGWTPLFIAAQRGHVGVVNRLLQDPRVNPNHVDNFNEYNPLLIAAKSNQHKVMEVLLANEKTHPGQIFDVREGTTILHQAVKNGYVGLISRLLARNDINPNQGDSAGNTPFYSACEFGQTEAARILLANRKVNPHQANHFGDIPFLIAAQNGSTGVVALLLAREDIDPNQATKSGATALLFAVEKGYTEMAELLLARNDVNPNLAHSNGATPLILAAYFGRVDAVKALLARQDVNLDHEGPGGKTALQFAQEKGYIEIETLIREAIKSRQVSVSDHHAGMFAAPSAPTTTPNSFDAPKPETSPPPAKLS